jgi:hypothetical protein
MLFCTSLESWHSLELIRILLIFNPMRNHPDKVLKRSIPVIIFFLAFFVYFSVFACYHLIFQEQTRLFRFDASYFHSFLSMPGGLSEYLGAFLIQFCISPLLCGIVITLAGFVVFLLTLQILRQHQTDVILPAILPVLFLCAFQSDPSYALSSTIGFIFVLGYFALFSSARNKYLRYILGITGVPGLYFVAGGYALSGLALILVHELIYDKSKSRHVFVFLIIIISIATLYISSHYFYYSSLSKALLVLLPYQISITLKYLLIFFLAYLPLVLIISGLFIAIQRKESIGIAYNWKGILTSLLLIAGSGFWIQANIFDRKSEIIFRLDHCVQQSKWTKVLKISAGYPGANRIVMYYTNLALVKTGQMGDRMFRYPQSGINGLWLEWKRNEIAPFFGGEIFYQLAYNSEAYRWAFESMVAKGPNPRSLKRLVLSSLIDGDTAIAQKFLNVLDQTLFYRKWARKYKGYIQNPALLLKDKEIRDKQYFDIKHDFIADRNNYDIGLVHLLENHPDNRMAFEYYMSSLLLTKNLDGFAANIGKIRDFGFKSIPIHYEEALLAYMTYHGTNIVPEGFTINPITQMEMAGYMRVYSNYQRNPELVVKQLSKSYGSTYWFYLSFINITKPGDESENSER